MTFEKYLSNICDRHWLIFFSLVVIKINFRRTSIFSHSERAVYKWPFVHTVCLQSLITTTMQFYYYRSNWIFYFHLFQILLPTFEDSVYCHPPPRIAFHLQRNQFDTQNIEWLCNAILDHMIKVAHLLVLSPLQWLLPPIQFNETQRTEENSILARRRSRNSSSSK